MAMILYNPTNEDMGTQYVGETVKILSGSKVRVDDPRGRHVLNTLGPRGLMALEYGDEGEGEVKKKKEGIERNLAFKRKQVIDFNTHNEQQKQGNRPYIIPTKQITEYAKELGIGLREPYNVEDQAMKDIAAVKKESAEKDEKIKQQDSDIKVLTGQVQELIDLNKRFMKMSGEPEPDAEKPPEEREDGINIDFRKFGKNNFADWLVNNWNLVETYPEDIQKRLADKFHGFYDTEMPASKAEMDEFVQKQKIAA